MSYELKNVESERRPSELDLLKIIPSDLKIFDNISVSSGHESELSGPFSDYEKSEGFVEKRKSNELNKMDLYSYFSFSNEFKTAMEVVKNETKTSDAEYEKKLEEPEMLSQEKSQIEMELENKAEKLLREARFVIREKKKSAQVEEKSCESVKGGKKGKAKEEKKWYQDDDYFDTMSGYWRMLSAYDQFNISHPDYNAYECDKPHWLQTKPIPLQIMTNSQEKCLQWLKENFQIY